MTIERYTYTVPASGVIQVPRGNFFLLTTATPTAVNLRFQREGTSEGINGAAGGVYMRRVQPWDFAELFGAAGVAVEFWCGHEQVDRDETDIRLAVSVISGSVAVVEQPLTSLGNLAPVSLTDAAETLVIAANAARKRLRLSLDSAGGGSVFLRSTTGGNNIYELQPGTWVEFKNTSAVYARNDTGGAINIYRVEEA